MALRREDTDSMEVKRMTYEQWLEAHPDAVKALVEDSRRLAALVQTHSPVPVPARYVYAKPLKFCQCGRDVVHTAHIGGRVFDMCSHHDCVLRVTRVATRA